MTIGIDFDGTCVTHEFPLIGKDIGAVPVLKKLVANGHQLILNTMRSDNDKTSYLTDAVNWFKENDIPLYGINRNPRQGWTSSPKVWADIYIDDAGLGIPLIVDLGKLYVDWKTVEYMLEITGTIS